MTTLSNIPSFPFSGFRAAVYAAVIAKPGVFVAVPAPVGRGSDVFKAAKKINLRLADEAAPFEVRVTGTAKEPSGVGLFVVGTSSTGRAPNDSSSARKRTSFAPGAAFGTRIAPSLPLRVASVGERVEARTAKAEVAKAEVVALALGIEGEAEARESAADATDAAGLSPAAAEGVDKAVDKALKARRRR